MQRQRPVVVPLPLGSEELGRERLAAATWYKASIWQMRIQGQVGRLKNQRRSKRLMATELFRDPGIHR